MKILSRYSVLEYLLWVKNNHYSVDDRNEDFCKLLNSGYQTIRVFNNKRPSRNIVFKFELTKKKFIFKQHGPDITKKKTYFEAEQFALNTNKSSSLLPILVYQDRLANIIITEELSDYKSFGETLKSFKSKMLSYDEPIKILIADMTNMVKAIHQFPCSKNDSDSYASDSLNEFLSNKPELWGNVLTTQFIDYRHKSCFTHLDLKGSNILLKGTEIKFLDWEMSAKNDPYFDFCYLFFEIGSVIISPDFLSADLSHSSMINWARKYINIFIETYQKDQPKISRNKLIVFFKIIFWEMKENKEYEKNIERLFSKS